MAALRRLSGFQRLLGLPARAISSGRTTNSTVAVEVPSAFDTKKVAESCPVEEDDDHENIFTRNPDFHGFSEDPVADVQNMRLAFFFGISICIVLGTTFLYYLPDHKMIEWARREAERKIKERTEQGLPILSSNYYDPSKIVLLPEEEE